MQNWMTDNDEDDDDIRDILQGSGGETDDLLLDQENPLQEEFDEMVQNIHQLKFGDLGKRVDALVWINEVITNLEENRRMLEKNADELINAFTFVMKDIFEKPVQEIPLQVCEIFHHDYP